MIDHIEVTPTRLEVHIGARGDFKHETEFIGAKGRVLLETAANPAVYELTTDEPYVRARIRGSGGEVAWVQPVFTTDR